MKSNKFISKLNFSVNFQNLRIFISLVKKELQYYFYTPVFYIISSLFVISVFLIFFGIFRFIEFGTTNLTPLFTSALLAFIFIIPALTMGSIAKEKQLGTIEFILTKPFSIFTFVVAKFLSVSFLILLLSLFLLPCILFINRVESLDLGQVSLQIFGIFLVGTSIASIGIAVSSFNRNEIPSFLITVLICSFLILSGSEYLRILPFQFDSFFSTFGIYSHYSSLSRGVADFRDLVYFLSLIILSLGVGSFALMREKYPKNFKNKFKFQLLVFGLFVLFILVSFFGQKIPGRIDFTANKIYTLSDVTKDILKEIKDVNLKISLYTSSNLPIQFQKDLQIVQDILRDYQSYSGGRIDIEVLYTDRNEEAKQKAQNIGLREVLFSVNSEDSANRTIGYLGLGFEYKDQTDTLELTQEVNTNLEFEITKKIKSLTDSKKPKIRFINNNVARLRTRDYTILNQSLNELYDIDDIILNKDTQLDEFDLIVLASPNQKFDEQIVEKLRSYYESGGRIFFLTDPIEVSNQTLIPVPNEFSLRNLFEPYGILVDENLVYDLEFNNQINLSNSLFPLIIDYPFWLQAIPSNSEILKDDSPVSILWGSSVNTSNAKAEDLIVLLTTSDRANFQTNENLNITPNQEFNQTETDQKLLLSVGIKNSNEGKAIIVGDSLFLSDDIITQSNLNFALSSIEWLTDTKQSLSLINSKNRAPVILELSDSDKTNLVSYSIFGPFLMICVVGACIYVVRKKEIKVN